MTTPEQMRASALASMRYLDSTLPNGSVALMMGLADGTVLYEALHARIHPIGMLNQDVVGAVWVGVRRCGPTYSTLGSLLPL